MSISMMDKDISQFSAEVTDFLSAGVGLSSPQTQLQVALAFGASLAACLDLLDSINNNLEEVAL